jgi:hypothetical protein
MTDRKRKLDLGDADPAAAKRASSVPPPPSAEGAEAGGVNPYTGRPYSPRYYEILAKRKGESICRKTPVEAPQTPPRCRRRLVPPLTP